MAKVSLLGLEASPSLGTVRDGQRRVLHSVEDNLGPCVGVMKDRYKVGRGEDDVRQGLGKSEVLALPVFGFRGLLDCCTQTSRTTMML